MKKEEREAFRAPFYDDIPAPVMERDGIVLLRVTQEDSHVHVRVFSGPERGRLVNNGFLVFLPDEWEAFKRCANKGLFLFEEKEAP